MSHEKKKPLTFHDTGVLIGILIVAYYNPHIAGEYNPLDTLKVFSLLCWKTILDGGKVHLFLTDLSFGEGNNCLNHIKRETQREYTIVYTLQKHIGVSCKKNDRNPPNESNRQRCFPLLSSYKQKNGGCGPFFVTATSRIIACLVGVSV